MRSTGLRLLVILLMVLFCFATNAFSWSIFSSSSTKTTPQLGGATVVADFSIDGAKDPRGARLLENARRRIAGPATCWNEAYGGLFASCADIMADKERQSRLAWHLSGCFQEDSGQPPLPHCDDRSAMVNCRKRLTDSEGKVFLEFFLETNTLCHQLQAEAFKHNTERLVNDLSRSSKSAHEKLEVIKERSDHLLQESENLRGSLSSIAAQTDHLAAVSKAVGAQIGDVLEQSMAISEQSKEIAGAQAELKAGQAEMRGAVEAGMARVEESYWSLGDGIDKLREDALGVEKGIRAVGDAMSSKMDGLQRTADDIGSVAGRSWENQMQLLDGQAKAMRGLNDLYSFQAQALEESRETIQKLAHFGQQQQEELLVRQEEIRHAHHHLIQNSHLILEAQEIYLIMDRLTR